MTVRFLVVYETPANPGEFDRHYEEVHIPLVRQLPRLRRYVVGRGAAAVRGEPCYLVAEADWDTMDELRAAFASPQGRATAADAARLQELAPVRSMIFTAHDALGAAAPGRAPAEPPGLPGAGDGAAATHPAHTSGS